MRWIQARPDQAAHSTIYKRAAMNNAVSLALLAAGIMLTSFGVSEMNSFSSEISRLFTGAPTNRSIWMMIGGVVLAVFGLTGLVQSSRNN
jgi:uncharacterized membrane protein YidH (DUF202 family)